MSERAVASAERLTSKAANLRSVAQANRQLAASATEGSDAWRIYTAQADKADAALMRLMGTSKASGAAAAASAAGTAELSAEMRTVERDSNKLTRGLLAGTGALSGMGRSLAFASTMFIGAAGLSAAIKDSVDQGEQFARDQASLSTAITKTGGSVRDLLPQINEWATKQADLGVSITGSETALARMIELTGNTKQAVSAYEMALAISKATGMDFQAVSLATGKAMEGQTQALARYIGKIPASMSQQELYNAVMKKYGGQAEANTVASDKLRASVSNIETEVGTALLPTVDRYLNKASAWLDNSENQKRVADDVKTAVGDLGGVLHEVGNIIGDVDKVTGSFKHTLELLLGLAVANKLSTWGNSLYAMAGAEATASAEAKGLMGWLSGLSKIGPIVIPVGIAYFVEKYGAHNTVHAGLNPFDSQGPDVAKDQTITVGGKSYPIGTSVAISALRKAGFSGPLDSAAQEVAAAKSLGGSSSLTGSDVAKLKDLAKTLAEQGKAAVTVGAASVPTIGGNGAGLGTTPLGNAKKGKKGSTAYHGPTGDALLPASLRQRLASQDANYRADSAYAASLTGHAADAYHNVLIGDLRGQAKTLADEAHALETKLKTASAKQKPAIEQELAKVKTSLTQVQDQVVQNLQANVQAMQGQVSTIFSSVQSQMDAALGSLYFQNGLQTPSEAKLAAMQAEDRTSSLNDALTKAQQQLADDVNGAVVQQVLDISTGKMTNIYGSKGTPQQIAADNAAIEAAKRAIAENDLQTQATKERTAADNTYKAKVDDLNSQLATWITNVENGTGNMKGLNAIAAEFGITLGTKTIPDLGSLRDAIGNDSSGLIGSFKQLEAYIAKITGNTPAPAGAPAPITTKPSDIVAAATAAYAKGGGSAVASTVAALLGSADLANALPPTIARTGKLTAFADGGVALGPMVNLGSRAIFGDAGTEAYLPLSNPRATGMIRDAIGGGGTTVVVQVNAPHYVGSQQDLARALKSPGVIESVATAVIMAGRRGHIRQSSLPT